MERRAVLYTGMRLDGSIADRAGWRGRVAARVRGQRPRFLQRGGRGGDAGPHLPPNRGGALPRAVALSGEGLLRAHPPAKRGEATSVDGPPERPIERRRGEGDIWVCGRAELARRLAAADCIDRYHLSVLPSLLGEGLSLFGGLGVERPLRLVSAGRYNGIVDLVYERRGEAALL